MSVITPDDMRICKITMRHLVHVYRFGMLRYRPNARSVQLNPIIDIIDILFFIN